LTVFDLLLHQPLDLVRAGIADDDQADVVADELRQLLVLEDRWEVLEQFRFVRIVDMCLDLVPRAGAEVAHEGEEEAEHGQKVFPFRYLVSHRLHDAAAGIGNQ
jgi:hypothetical protein